jgi:putative Mn2+ efflux pump MntP
MATSSRPARVSAPDPTRGWSLLGLSVATSIDALAVGLTFGVLGDTIWLAVLIIGLVTAALTTLGMHLGSHLGSLFGRRFSRVTEIIGGLVLIGIGVKILVEHVM